jgi:hypothetical protein
MKKINIKDIEKIMEETGLTKEYMDMGLRTPEQVEQLKHILGNFALSNMGDKIYKLPGGGYCGQGGWDLFQKALAEELKNIK